MRSPTRTRSTTWVMRWKNRAWRRWLVAIGVVKVWSVTCWTSFTCTRRCFAMRMESLTAQLNSLAAWTTSGNAINTGIYLVNWPPGCWKACRFYILLLFLIFIFNNFCQKCLQCIDAVGWAAGRSLQANVLPAAKPTALKHCRHLRICSEKDCACLVAWTACMYALPGVVCVRRTTPRKRSDEETRKSRRYSVGSVPARQMSAKNRNRMPETREPAGTGE